MTQPTPATANDLERLRDILYGEQTRTTEQRHSDFENRLRELGAQLESAQHKIGEQMNRQGSAQSSSQQELADRLSAQLTDLQTQLNALRQELSQRLDQLDATSRQRTEAVRTELLALTTDLEEKKAARHDLGQMLVELGQRLQSGDQPS
jgi:chromosome segregation ATPase